MSPLPSLTFTPSSLFLFGIIQCSSQHLLKMSRHSTPLHVGGTIQTSGSRQGAVQACSSQWHSLHASSVAITMATDIVRAITSTVRGCICNKNHSLCLTTVHLKYICPLRFRCFRKTESPSHTSNFSVAKPFLKINHPDNNYPHLVQRQFWVCFLFLFVYCCKNRPKINITPYDKNY